MIIGQELSVEQPQFQKFHTKSSKKKEKISENSSTKNTTFEKSSNFETQESNKELHER